MASTKMGRHEHLSAWHFASGKAGHLAFWQGSTRHSTAGMLAQGLGGGMVPHFSWQARRPSKGMKLQPAEVRLHEVYCILQAVMQSGLTRSMLQGSSEAVVEHTAPQPETTQGFAGVLHLRRHSPYLPGARGSGTQPQVRAAPAALVRGREDAEHWAYWRQRCSQVGSTS